MRFPHRSLIRLSGPDTIALLERTVTNSVQDWAAGEALGGFGRVGGVGGGGWLRVRG